MLDKLQYLKADLKKCVMHHILLTWHQVITICFQILKTATEKWLKGQSELFYFTSIENLKDRYKLCSDKGGDYVDK